MPNQYSLDDIESLLQSFGLPNQQPSLTQCSRHVVYFRRLLSTKHIIRFVLNDYKMYQKQSAQQSLAHRVAFLFENYLGKMAIVLDYKPSQSRDEKSLWMHHALVQPGQILNIYGFSFAKNQKYLQQLLSALAKPAACYSLMVEDNILFAETIRLVLVEGIETYQKLRRHLAIGNQPNIFARHEIQAIRQFERILQGMDEDVQKEMLNSMDILVKYELLKQAQAQIQKLPAAQQRFAFAEQLQRKIFLQSYTNFSALKEYFSATGFLPVLTFLRVYQVNGGQGLSEWLTREKEKREEVLEEWLDALQSDLPVPTIRETLRDLLRSLITNNYVTFLSQLFGFLFDQCTAWPILSLLKNLRPLICLLGASIGFGVIYTEEVSETLYLAGVTLLYTILAKALQPEHLNIAEGRVVRDSWFIQQIKQTLPILFAAFIRSAICLEFSLVIEAIVASVMRIILDCVFSGIMLGVPITSEFERSIHLFLFIRLSLLAFADIGDRYDRRAVIQEKFSSIKTMQAHFSLWGWWFFNACFRLTDQNATHVRVLDCYANQEMLNWDNSLGSDIRESHSCVLQREFILHEDVFAPFLPQVIL